MKGVIRELRESDLPSLTRMWNESDSVWPGGFTSGMALTVERTEQWIGGTTYLAPLVAVVDDRVVGFCGLTAMPDERDVAYISVLGVHPEALSQGYGRDLIRLSIKLSTELGFRRLDLDTWSANVRAIPFYKRTGFYWVPNTSVHMQNFLPLLLRHPLVQRFLGEEDWYPCLRPQITLEEDAYLQGCLPAFPYVFERDGARLCLMLEVGTGGILAYEDAQVRIDTTLAQPRFVVGVPTLARWRVARTAAGEGDEAVSFFAEGTGGVRASRATGARLAKAATFEVEAVATRPTANGDADPAQPGPGLRAQVGVGDVALTLDASFPTVPALEVSAEPPQVSLAPGQPGSFWLCLRSNLTKPTHVRLQLTACDDIAVRPLQPLAFTLAPGAAASALVEATAPAGLHTLRVVPALSDEEDGREELAEDGLAEVPIIVGGPSDAFAYRAEWGAVLENAHLRALVQAKGGVLRLQTKNPTRDLVEQRTAVGPPWWPTEFAQRTFTVAVEAREGRASVHLAVESADYPGLIFRRTVTMTASPRLETEFSLVNTSAEPCRLGVRVEHMMRLHASLIAVPLAEGLLVDSAEGADWEVAARSPDRYAETWASLEREDLTVGFLWPEGSSAEFSRRYGPFFALPEVDIPPGATVDAGRVVVYGGSGGWRTVRDQWRRLVCPQAPESPPKPIRAAEIAVLPNPIAWSGEPVATVLEIRHLRGRALSGKASLDLPEGWQASAATWTVVDLRRGDRSSLTTTIAPLPAALAQPFPAAAEATLFLDANLALGRQPLALLVLGQNDLPVRIAEAPAAGVRTFQVDNGWARFAVAPQFNASVVAYEHGGQNHLLSAFPTPGELMWQRPWFGGIGPVVAPAGIHFHPIHAGRLYEEEFAVDFPVSRDWHGGRWQGIRLTADLHRPAGLHLAVDYLTVGGSNLLLAAVSLHNRTGAPQRVQSFLGCYLRLGGEVEHTVLRYLAGGEHNARREAYDVWLAPSADWAAVESEPSGLTAALVSPTPWAYIQAYDLGLEGAHLFNVGETLLAPDETGEYLSLFVLTDSAAKARRYRALGWSGEIGLPPEH